MSFRKFIAPLAIGVLFVPVACSSSADDAPGTETDSGSFEDTSSPDVAEAAVDSSADVGRDAADSSAVDSSPADVATSEVSDATDAYSDVTTDGDAKADGDASDVAKACTPGAIENETCGKCGTRSRLCDTTKTWLDWGACGEETGLCVPGATGSVACGRCGTRAQTCSATCEWAGSACTGEKACTAGSVETQTGTCLDSTKVKRRTCADTCEWSDWSDCL